MTSTKCNSHTIIPKPVSVIYNHGDFAITSSARIVVHMQAPESSYDEVHGVALYLADRLRASTGYAMPIVSSGLTGDIELRTIEKNETLSENVDYLAAGDEGYALVASADGLLLTAYAAEGLFRGIQTLRQLLPAEVEKSAPANEADWILPCVTIVDYPRYPYRGVMLDVCRKFFGKEEVMRQIDLLAQYKMNVMHLHLTEDQGYRIAFDGYPELTEFGGMAKCLHTDAYSVDDEIGGRRRLAPGSMHYGTAPGYYTKDDFLEILAYADKRFVTVIPELEIPSHCYAQLLSLPALCENGELPDVALTYDGVGKNNAFWSEMVGQSITLNPDGVTEGAKYTKAFIKDIFTQMADMLYGRHKYIHIGGDEAMNQDFDDFIAVTKLAIETVRSKGLLSMQWNMTTAEKQGHHYADIFQNWSAGAEVANNALASGAKVLASICDKTYLDHFSSETMPVGHYWATKNGISVNDAYNWDPEDAVPEAYRGQGNVIGVEAPMWSEIYGSRETLDILLYPRIQSLAEVAWSPHEKRHGTGEDSAWCADFQPRLAAQGNRMFYQGITFMNETSIWPEMTIPGIAPDNVPYAQPIQIPINTRAGGKFDFPAVTPQGGSVSIRLVSQPTQGTVELSPDGNWCYTPKQDFAGRDGFTVAFIVEGLGIPMGPPVAAEDTNRGITEWNALRDVNIRVANTGSEPISSKATCIALSPTNCKISFEPPVSDLLQADFSIPGSTVRMAETFDNGSSYLLVTTPRDDSNKYTLRINKNGYTINDVLLC